MNDKNNNIYINTIFSLNNIKKNYIKFILKENSNLSTNDKNTNIKEKNPYKDYYINILKNYNQRNKNFLKKNKTPTNIINNDINNNMFNYNNNQKFLSNRTFSHNFINIKQNKINNNFLKKNLEKEKFFKYKKKDKSDKIHFYLSNKIIKFDLDAHSNNSEKINENFIKNYNTINKKRSQSDKLNNHKNLILDNNNSNPNILNENKTLRKIFPYKKNNDNHYNKSLFLKNNLNNNIYSYNFYKNEKKFNNNINIKNDSINYNNKDNNNNNNKLKIDIKIPFENIFLQNKLKKYFRNNNNNNDNNNNDENNNNNYNNNNNEYRKVIKLKSKNNKLKVNNSL